MNDKRKGFTLRREHSLGVLGIVIIVTSAAAAIYGRNSAPVIEQAAAAAVPAAPAMAVSMPATPQPVYVPPIELESLPAMTERLNGMIRLHNEARAARWNAINQDNLRAAALIECYRSGRGGCE